LHRLDRGESAAAQRATRLGEPLPLAPAAPQAAPPSAPLAAPSTALPLSSLLQAAVPVLAAVQAGRSMSEALQAVDPAARPGAQALSFRALRHWAGARAALRRLAPRSPAAPLDALLRLALALAWPDGHEPYAPHTLVDQAVAAARRFDAHGAGFVNAVLRRFLREREALVDSLQADDPEVRHETPRWWIERLRHEWPQHWQSMLGANHLAPPMWLRVNTRRVSVADYRQRLDEAGLPADPSPSQAEALCLRTPVPVSRLPGFDAGWVSVQDLSAQRAAPLVLGQGPARLAPGARVLDACAAPGGKTAHLLELATLDLLALDHDAARLARVEQGLARLGLAARTLAADAGRPADWWDGRPFDAILLDAPCTASGIVRRHPDVPWLRRPGDVSALAAGQARLLDALWPLLAPRGRLVYATCSVFRDEGERQIEAFLQRTPGARVGLMPGHANGLPDNQPTEATPAEQGGDAVAAPAEPAPGDGFFYACLDRTD
jgi:16S rRNA (cytosine967-C5)-methyltransferase